MKHLIVFFFFTIIAALPAGKYYLKHQQRYLSVRTMTNHKLYAIKDRPMAFDLSPASSDSFRLQFDPKGAFQGHYVTPALTLESGIQNAMEWISSNSTTMAIRASDQERFKYKAWLSVKPVGHRVTLGFRSTLWEFIPVSLEPTTTYYPPGLHEPIPVS